MKHLTTKTKKYDEIKDITCDSCGKSCKTDYGFEFMEMSAKWGFLSNNDLEQWDAQICEACVANHFGFIKFQKNIYL